MIEGIVTSSREAVVPIELRGPNKLRATVRAIVDTGFTGSLLIPLQTAEDLGFLLSTTGRATLADGQIVTFDVYEGTVVWHDAQRRVEVIASTRDCDSLIGMKLLEGCRVQLDVRHGGTVVIEPISEEEAGWLAAYE